MQPPGLVWLTFGVLATLVAASTFLFWAETGRHARLPGVLMPDQGLVRIEPQVQGVVSTLSSREGQVVRAGEPLFTVKVEAAVSGAGAQAALQETFDTRTRSLAESARRTTSWLASRQTELQQRSEAVQRELAQLEIQARLHQQRLVLAEQALGRLDALRKDHFVSDAQVQTKTEDVLGLQAEGAGLERQRQTLARELRTLQADLRAAPLEAAQQQAQFRRDHAEVAELAARDAAQRQGQDLVVRAPADGVLASLQLDAGQAVRPDTLAATLMPAGARLQAQLYAPSQAMGFVQPGQTVRLRLQAYPYQKFGARQGVVLRVARAPLPASDVAPWLGAGAAANEPLYRITVALDDAAAATTTQPLLPGMQLEADVLLERRRLIEWMFEPLLAWWRR